MKSIALLQAFSTAFFPAVEEGKQKGPEEMQESP